MRIGLVLAAGALSGLLAGAVNDLSAQVQNPPTSLPQQPPAAAASQTTPAAVDPFQSRIERAAQLLDTDAQAALEALDHLAVESIELRKTRPLTTAERIVHRQLFSLRARGHLQSMNSEKVDDSYRELLRVDPFFNAPLAPREQETLDALRSRESGLLEVSGSVRDCRIVLDGVEVGVTGDVPIRVSLVAGMYELRLEKVRHLGVGTRVTVVAGQTLSVSDLTPTSQVPPIAFLTDRDGIEVLVDNQPAGLTTRLSDLRGKLSVEESTALDQAVAQARFDATTAAAFLLRDPPMDRTLGVRFHRDCFIEEARTVVVTADTLAKTDPAMPLLWFGESLTIRMRADVGTLRVSSAPSDADVLIDGQLTGRTPFERNVCSGEHRLRVRHRIGSYAVTAMITRGRTEVVDVTLKPGLGFLGAVESVQGTIRPAVDLTGTIDRALASTVSTFRLSAQVELPPEVQRWTDTSTTELVAASDRGDSDAVKRLLRQASDNYDAPLLMAVVARGAAASAGTSVELVLYWFDHAGVDRVPVSSLNAEALAQLLDQLDVPADTLQLVYQNDLGLRVADTLLPDAPLVVVSVDAGSPAALAGIKPGESIAKVDKTAMGAAQLADLVRQKKPGDVLNLALAGAGTQPRQAAVPVQRKPRRAPVFDRSMFGNAIIAKLHAASAVASGSPDRELLAFNIGLVHMRFRQWRQALELLSGLGQVPNGSGVNAGSVLYFRARCHLELGERDRAIVLLREASTFDTQVLADDGASVGAVVTLRLSSLTETARQPPIR